MLANYFYFHFYAHSQRLLLSCLQLVWVVVVVAKQWSAMGLGLGMGAGDAGIIDVVYGAIYDDSTILFQPHSAQWSRSSRNLNLLLAKSAAPVWANKNKGPPANLWGETMPKQRKM